MATKKATTTKKKTTKKPASSKAKSTAKKTTKATKKTTASKSKAVNKAQDRNGGPCNDSCWEKYAWMIIFGIAIGVCVGYALFGIEVS